MKKFVFFCIICLVCISTVFASEFATMKNGKVVFLKDDGTWNFYSYSIDVKNPQVGKWAIPGNYREKLVQTLLEEANITPDMDTYTVYREALLSNPKTLPPNIAVEITKRQCIVKMNNETYKMDYSIDPTSGLLTCVNENGGRIQFGVFSPDYLTLVIMGDTKLSMERIQ